MERRWIREERWLVYIKYLFLLSQQKQIKKFKNILLSIIKFAIQTQNAQQLPPDPFFMQPEPPLGTVNVFSPLPATNGLVNRKKILQKKILYSLQFVTYIRCSDRTAQGCAHGRTASSKTVGSNRTSFFDFELVDFLDLPPPFAPLPAPPALALNPSETHASTVFTPVFKCVAISPLRSTSINTETSVISMAKNGLSTCATRPVYVVEITFSLKSTSSATMVACNVVRSSVHPSAVCSGF